MEVEMNSLSLMALRMIMMTFAFLGGLPSGSVFAQHSSGAGNGAEELPPDVYPDTLSRIHRVKREDFATDEEKQEFDRVIALSPPEFKKNFFGGWLGPSGIRMQIPEVAEIYLKQSALIREKSELEPKYRELAVLVATRECDNKSEFIDHASREITQKQLGPHVVEIVRNRQDTKGLEEKEALIIQFGRELFNQPKVSSKTFAEMERNFGQKATLGITLTMGYYVTNELVMRAYDTQLFRKNANEKPSPAPW
jgi:4-carboxymuconolactone decarboxylase